MSKNKSRKFRILAGFAFLVLATVACDDPTSSGGAEKNAGEALEAVITTQAVIHDTAEAVYDAAGNAAEAVGVPEADEDAKAVWEAVKEASPGLLEVAVEAAKKVAEEGGDD